MTAFKKITNNPIFAASITEIIYDARLFWGYIAPRLAYDIANLGAFPTDIKTTAASISISVEPSSSPMASPMTVPRRGRKNAVYGT